MQGFDKDVMNCKLCLTVAESSLEIFGEEGQKLGIAEIVSKHFGFVASVFPMFSAPKKLTNFQFKTISAIARSFSSANMPQLLEQSSRLPFLLPRSRKAS
jgi:hypothetical protein